MTKGALLLTPSGPEALVPRQLLIQDLGALGGALGGAPGVTLYGPGAPSPDALLVRNTHVQTPLGSRPTDALLLTLFGLGAPLHRPSYELRLDYITTIF